MSRIVIAVESDLHCGSKVGVCPPTPITGDDGETYIPSEAQRWLWDARQRWLDRVEELRQGSELRYVCNGDLVDGPGHHGTHQSISLQGYTQGDIAHACLAEVVALKPDHMFFVRGTEAHVGKGASSEEAIARSLLAQGQPVQKDIDRGTASWYFLTMRAGSKLIEFAHHGQAGHRPWTEAAAVQRQAAEIFYRRFMEDPNQIPDLAVGSHYHRMFDSYDAHPVRVIQTPAFQLATSYVWKRYPNTMATIGGIIITVDGDRLDVEKVVTKPDARKVWTP